MFQHCKPGPEKRNCTLRCENGRRKRLELVERGSELGGVFLRSSRASTMVLLRFDARESERRRNRGCRDCCCPPRWCQRVSHAFILERSVRCAQKRESPTECCFGRANRNSTAIGWYRAKVLPTNQKERNDAQKNQHAQTDNRQDAPSKISKPSVSCVKITIKSFCLMAEA